MVDCRLCKNHYTIFKCEIGEIDLNENAYVCLAKEVFIDKEYLTEGPCDLYDDVDGYDTKE